METIICIGGAQHGKEFPDHRCRHLEAMAETGLGFYMQRYDRRLYGEVAGIKHFYVYNKLKPFSKATLKKVRAYL
jgi:hypothetical protein